MLSRRAVVAMGAITWLGAAAVFQAPLAANILAFAAVVIYPLGIYAITLGAATPANHAPADKPLPLANIQPQRTLLPAIAFCLAVTMPAGTLAGLLSLPWLMNSVATAAGITMDLLRRPSRNLLKPATLCVMIAFLYLPIGAAWATASCFQWQPMGFDATIVRLTGVHFHYAGFGLAIIAANVLAGSLSRISWFVASGILIAVWLVAIGITASPVLEVVGAVWLANSCFALAIMQLRLALTSRSSKLLTLFGISSVSIMSGMTLAMVYAISEFTSQQWIGIPMMIPTHGLTNAFGFVLCGLLGCRELEHGEIASVAPSFR